MDFWNKIPSFPGLKYISSLKEEKSETSIKWSLGLVLSFLLLVYLLLLIVLLPNTSPNQKRTNSTHEIGESHGYLKASDYIIETRNLKVDPCDDFYEYVCGNYPENHPMPPGESGQSVLYLMRKNTEYQLLELLQSTEKSSSEAISKMKVIFNACVREKGIVKITPQATVKMIKSVGHWPIVTGKRETDIALQEIIEKIHSLGTPLPWKVAEQWYENKTVSLKFKVGDLRPLSIKSLQFTEEQKAEIKKDPAPIPELEMKLLKKDMHGRIQKFARDAGYPENPNLEKDVEEMLRFNLEFLKILGLDLKKILLAGIPELAHSLITPDTIINVENSVFVENIAHLIRNTEQRIVVNYLQYFLMPNEHLFSGKQVDVWSTCKNNAMKMREAVGALYESRNSIAEMTENLREAFLEMLEENDWMDEETKRKAKEKAQEIFAHIGYSEYAFDDEKLDKYYEEIDVSNYNELYLMVKSLDAWARKNQYRELLLGNRHDFPGDSTETNAFYEYTKNLMAITAAYAQFPNFLKDQPQSLNYGGLGSTIGHELTHGFDDEGKNYDAQGKSRNWWANHTLEKFEEKSKCMVDQYSAIEVSEANGRRINGKKTLGENIADNGGIREAFKAYKKYVKHHGKEPKLPGVELTDEQLFFVGYANSYCSSMTKKEWIQALYDVHSPNKYRTNIALQNMPTFSETFNCPVGSPMNPEKKCRVW